MAALARFTYSGIDRLNSFASISSVVATRAIGGGEAVRRYGQIIGFASRAIAPGEWVHEHNVGLGEDKGDFARDYRFCAEAKPVAMVPEAERATFEGYRRADGRVGTRNYVGVLTSVNCSATVARFIAEEARRREIEMARRRTSQPLETDEE